MKPVWVVLVAATLVASYAVGRQSSDAVGAVASMESFRLSITEGDALTRSARFDGFLETLSEENLDAALAIVLDRYAWLTTDELRTFFMAWARFDPQGAIAWGHPRYQT